MILDAEHGWGKYTVTNLGACGSTMLKNGDSPYWKRPQYQSLINSTWDIVTIMLGTNDAKDAGSHGRPNWQHDCGGTGHTTLDGCTFASDFMAIVNVIRTLGKKPGGPDIYVLIPPPLMELDGYGMNQTVINSVFPKLMPLIENQVSATGLIDIYAGMGGVSDWKDEFPAKGCELNSSWAPCALFCDAQSCDQCHPNDHGYHQLAKALHTGLALPPSPTPPPSPPPSPGAWLYEREGDGKLFVPAANFTANNNSGRGGALAWDACRNSKDLRFDNGNLVWQSGSARVGGVSAGAGTKVKVSYACASTFSYPNTSVTGPITVPDGIRYSGWLYLEM